MQTQTPSVVRITRTTETGAAALTLGQLTAVIMIGIVFWFTAALTVQFGSAAGFFGATANSVLFVISIPIIWLAVVLTKRIARLQAGQTLPGIAIGGVAATFCDGIALTWGRGLYGSDPVQIVYGAAWILWGVGLFLLFAYIDDYR